MMLGNDRRPRTRWGSTARVVFGQALLLVLLAAVAAAGPIGEEVVRGNVSFSRQGDLTLIQASNNSIINYRGFDIAGHETVQFLQPSASARVLNRINSSAPTQIDGTLLANGHVYLVNPAGVFFGKNCVIDASGIHAAAARMSNADFLAGIDRFVDASGSVVNRGQILAGAVTFVGANVANYGSIVAENGTVVMAAGEDILIGRRDGHVFARIEGAAAGGAKAAVENAGSIQAGNGTVMLGVGDAYSLAVCNTGAIRARTATVDAGTATAEVSGTIETPEGGSVQVLGDKVKLVGATILAPGGSVLIGGDFQGGGSVPTASRTVVDADSSIAADRVIVWSDEITGFAGRISATFAEVSGKQSLLFLGTVDADTILLDPDTITVQAATPNINGDMTTGDDITLLTDLDSATLDFPGAASIITAGAVNGLLTGSNTLTLAAATSIAVNAAITGVGNASLVLDAPTVNLNQAISLAGSGTLSGGAGTTVVNVGANGGVQNGIDVVAATGTVNVTGSHNEDLAIAKALTLSGGGVGILNSSHTISSSNVTFTGWTLNGSGNETLITVDSSGSAISTVTISNNIFNLQTGDVGIWLGGSTPTNSISGITVSGNIFNGPAGGVSNPLRIGGWFGSSNLDVAISNLDFTQNTVDKGSIPVQLESKNLSDLLFSQNSFTDTEGVIYFWTQEDSPTGILSQFVFTQNTVDHTNSANGYGIGIDIFQKYSNSNYDTTPATYAVQITDNSFENMGSLDLGAAGILDTVSITSGGSFVVDASGNWWGTATPASIASQVTASRVDYTPWLDSGSDSDGVTAGFQGDFGTLHVDDGSPQVGTTARIAEGLGALAGGGPYTLNVHDGTYSEAVSIAQNTTVQVPSGTATADSWASTGAGITVGLSGNFAAASGTIAFPGPVILVGNTSLDTTASSSTISIPDVTGDYTLALALGGSTDFSLTTVDVDTLTLTSGDDLTLDGTLTTDTALDFTNLDEIFLAGDTTITTPQDITFDSDNTISSNGHHQLTISGDNVTLYQVGDGNDELGDVQVTAAGTLSLHDDFFLQGDASVTLGGTIAPGGTGSVKGKVEFDFDSSGSSSFSLASGSTLDIDMASDSNYDYLRLSACDSVDFGNASISGSVIAPYSPGSGDDYKIIDNGGTDIIANTGSPSPTHVTFSGENFQVSYGNDVELDWIAGIWKWTAGAGTNAWSNANNWDLAGAPAALVNGAQVQFDTANLNVVTPIQATNNDVSGLILGSIAFVDGGFSISGNAVTLTGGITNTAGANAVNIALAIPATSDQTFTVTAGTLTIGAAVTLGSALDIEGAGAAVFGSTLDGTQNVTINMNSASGTATFNAAVGNTNELATLLIDDSNGVTFANILKAQTVDIQDTTGTVAFQGNTTISTGLTTNSQGYSVAFTGAANSVAGDTTFSNTGGATFGALSTDAITFAGGLDTTAVTGGTTIAGTVATTDTDMDLGATTMAADATLMSGSGALNVASITDGANSYSLDLQDNTAASTGTVTFTGNVSINDLDTFAQPYAVLFHGSNSTVDTATAFLNTGGVTLGNNTGDSTTFSGGLNTVAVTGGTSIEGTVATTDTLMALGATTMTDDATIKSGSGMLTVTSITDGANSYSLDLQDAASTGTVTFVGNVTVHDLDTFAQSYNVLFIGPANVVDTNTSFINQGLVIFGDGPTDSSTFTGGLDTNNGPASTSVMGALSSGSNAMDLGDTTTDTGTATNFTASTLTFHGTLTPAGASVGTINVNGNLALANTATLDVQLGNTTDTIDQINVTGTVNLGGATLSGTLIAGTPTKGTTYQIISNDAADAVSNQFAQGATITISGKEFSIDYAAGDGNDVVLEKIATTVVWDGGSIVDSNWMTPENWVGDAIPDVGDVLEFAGAAQVTNVNNFPAGTDFDSIVFSATGFSLSGNGVDLTSGVSNDVGTNTIGLPLTVNGAQTFSAANATALTLNGATTLNDALTVGGAGTVDFVGDVNGAHNLIVNMPNGSCTFAGGLGNTNAINQLTVQDVDMLDVQGVFHAASVDLQDSSNLVRFSGATTTVDTTFDAASQGFDLEILSTTTQVGGAATLENTGTLTIGDGVGDSATFTGGLDAATGPSNTFLAGTVATTDQPLALAQSTMAANTTLKSDSGAITVASLTDGANSYTLSLMDNTAASTGTATFTGNVAVNAVTTFAQPYHVVFEGTSTVIDSATTFHNTGTLSLGDGTGDSTTFTAGLDTTVGPSMTNVAGTVQTTDSVMNLDAVTMLDNSTLVSGSANTYVVSITDNDNGYTLSLQDGAATGITRFSGTVNVGALTTFAGNYDVYLLGNTTVDASTTFQNTGVVILGDAVGDTLTFVGGLDTTNASQTRVTGTVATTNTQMDLGDTWLFGDATLLSGSGALDIASITDGANAYTLTLQDNTAASTGTVTFLGNASFATLTTFAQPYDVAFEGASTVIDSATSFLNTGTLALGNGNADSTTFTGGLDTTAGPSATTVAGTVATTNTPMDLDATTMTDDATLRSGSGALTVAGITDGGGSFALELQDVNPTSTGTVTFTDNVTVNQLDVPGGPFSVVFQGANSIIDTATTFQNSGAATFGNEPTDVTTFTGGLNTTPGPSMTNVAGTLATTNTGMDLGATTLVNDGTLKSGSGLITVASLTDGANSYTLSLMDDTAASTGTVTFQGDVAVNAITTFAQLYNVAFQGATTTVDTATAFLNTGTVSLGNGVADTTTFTGGLDTTGGPSATNIAGVVTTTNTAMDLGPTTMTANATLLTGSGTLGVDGITDGANSYTLIIQDLVATGPVTFGDSVTVSGLQTFSGPYTVAFEGAASTIDTATVFVNTGGVAFATGSSTTFTGGLDTTSVTGGTSLAGTVGTTNNPMNLGATTMTDDATLKSGSGTIDVAPLTDGAGSFTLSLQDNTAASTGTVTFLGNVDVNAITTFAQPYDVNFYGTTTNVDTATAFLNTGDVGLGNGAWDTTAFPAGLDTTGGPDDTAVIGTVTTTNSPMALFDVNMLGDTTLKTGSGQMTIQGIDGPHNLTLQDNTAASTGSVTFTQDMNIGGLTTFAQNYAIAFDGANSTIGGDTTFLNTGILNIGNDPADSTTFTGGLDTTGRAGAITNISGTVATTNAQMDLGTTSLAFDATLASGSGAINVASISDGPNAYALSLQVNVPGFTGPVTFTGDVAVATLTTFAQPYAVAFQGDNTVVDTDTTFANTGGLTLGDGVGDTCTFTGGLDTTAVIGGTNVAGTVETTGTQMDLGTAMMTANTIVKSGSGVLNIQSITDGASSFTLSLQENTAASTGPVTFVGNVDIDTLTTFARLYDVTFQGGGVITTPTVFENDGTLTFEGAGTTRFVGGLDTTNVQGGTITSTTVATTDTPMDFGDLTIAGNTVIDAQAGKTTFHNDIDNIAAGSFSVLGTGDIELNSTITVNGPVDLGGGLGAPPEVARIYKDTLGDVVITTTGHDFTMGTNQKLTVANGDLTIDATGANAYIGDLNSNGTITVTATGIKLIARGGGQVINLDGVSKSTDNSTSVVAMNVNLNGAVSAGLGRVSTPTSGDFNKGAVSYWTPLKLGGGALPVLVTTGAGTFPAGTPIDLAAGAVLFDLATALATAIPQPSPIAPAATYYPLDPAVKELLEQLGLFARELTPAEQAAYGSSTTFTFDDVIRKPEDEIGPEDYTVPAPRLPEDLVKATVETYRGIFWKENEYQGAAIKATLQKAFDAYKQKSPDAVDPAAFRKFLQDTPDQSDALKLLDDLKKLFEQIGYLGLTSVQQGISQGILVRDIVPTGMTPGQLIAAIKGVAPGQ